jgi:uncharacterized protein with GYD domain
MPKYLLEVTYGAEGAKALMSGGGSARKKAALAVAKSAGGKVEAFYFAFGKTDAYVVADLPDNVSAAALALTVSGGSNGAVTLRTTVLLTPAEVDQAAAMKVKYNPPKA